MYVPFILQDDDGGFHGNDWAQDFLLGTELRRDIWLELFKDEDQRDAMIPIWALAYEHCDAPELRLTPHQ